MINLKADTEEDLKVIAALLQDAILPIGDFAYFKAEKKVMFAVNRYCWENEQEKQRVNAVLTFLNVDKIQTQNIDITDRKQALYFLDISKEEGGVVIHFSDNKKMKLEVSEMSVKLVDTGEIWTVESTPNH